MVVGVFALGLCVWAFRGFSVSVSLDDKGLYIGSGKTARFIAYSDIHDVVSVGPVVRSGTGIVVHPTPEYLARTDSKAKPGQDQLAWTIWTTGFSSAKIKQFVDALQQHLRAAGVGE